MGLSTLKRRSFLEGSSLFTKEIYHFATHELLSVIKTNGIFVGIQATTSENHESDYRTCVLRSSPRKLRGKAKKEAERISYVLKSTSMPQSDQQWSAAYTGDKPDIGGDFLSQSVRHVNRPATVDYRSLNGNNHEYGKVYPYYFSRKATIADYAKPSDEATLMTLGSLGISRILPTNPVSGLGQFLVELKKDGIPKLPLVSGLKKRSKAVRDASRDAAGEYLNVQFGWVPFLRDIVDVISTIRNASAIIKRYADGSGKVTRRRYTFPVERSVTTLDMTQVGSYYGNPAVTYSTWYASKGTLLRTVETVRERWVSAAFTYYLPDADSISGKFGNAFQIANKLYGLQLTPDLVWKVMPWSWLVDWFTSAGSVVRNWSAFSNNNLVLRYAYLMEKTTITTTYSLTGASLIDGQSLNCSQSIVSCTKLRRRANPYGFGIKETELSAFQWSILAALGINRRPRSLT